ncbi:hypothetical protein BKA93DRAFT_219258 [Sparassis latifolia]
MTTLSAKSCAPRPSAISEPFPPPQMRAFLSDLMTFPSWPPPHRPALPGVYNAREHPPIQPQHRPIYSRRRNTARRARIRQHEPVIISEPCPLAEDAAVEWPPRLGPAEPAASRPARTSQARQHDAHLLQVVAHRRSRGERYVLRVLPACFPVPRLVSFVGSPAECRSQEVSLLRYTDFGVNTIIGAPPSTQPALTVADTDAKTAREAHKRGAARAS